MKQRKTKAIVAAALSALVVVVLLCLWYRGTAGTERTEMATVVAAKTPSADSQPAPADGPDAAEVPASAALPLASMTATQYEFDPVALSRARENPPYEFRGQGTSGWIVDRQGNVIIKSNEEIRIFGISVSPDKEKVLIKGGDGKSLIIAPSNGQKILPPYRPPGSRLFPFEWHWLGADVLFGVSGVQKTFHEGPHENCCNDDNVERTKFYAFDLRSERLYEVAMPGAVTQPVVNALDVTTDGHVRLAQDGPRAEPAQELGWFRIDLPKSP